MHHRLNSLEIICGETFRKKWLIVAIVFASNEFSVQDSDKDRNTCPYCHCVSSEADKCAI
jgi:hypothetical protein